MGSKSSGMGYLFYEDCMKEITFRLIRETTCAFHVDPDKQCGIPITGPPNKRYCDEHAKVNDRRAKIIYNRRSRTMSRQLARA